MATREDLYQRVTDKICADLEKGTRPWMKPWNSSNADGQVLLPLRSNLIPYKGINTLLLWATALERGYDNPVWWTYKQASAAGGQVRKGEQGSMVVYADKLVKKDEQTDEDKVIPYLKSYIVFNAEQIDGLPATFNAAAKLPLDPVQRITHADEFFHNTGADIRHGGNRAFYSPSTDHIQMPQIEAFRDAESHAATLAHESIHWTKHESRLDRDFGRKKFADAGYAKEELTAELGAAFVCAGLQITPEVQPDHADYIASWLKVLKEDKRAVFNAASHAQKAADYLHGLQPQAVPAPA